MCVGNSGHALERWMVVGDRAGWRTGWHAGGLQDSYKSALATKAKQQAKEEARKLKTQAEGENSSVRLEKELIQTIKRDNFRELTNVNLGWNAQNDHHTLGISSRKAIIFENDRVADVGKELLKLEYFKEQAEWVKDQMRKSNLFAASASIVKPTIEKKVSSRNVMNDLFDHSNLITTFRNRTRG